MERKFYNVCYSNVNIEGEPDIAINYYSHYDNSGWGSLVKEYKEEIHYWERNIKSIKEKYIVKTVQSKIDTYGEEIDGKYYDIITGIEVVPEVAVSHWGNVRNVNGKYYYNYEELNRDNVESEKIKFSHKSQVEVSTVYEFLKKLMIKILKCITKEWSKHYPMFQKYRNRERVK